MRCVENTVARAGAHQVEAGPAHGHAVAGEAVKPAAADVEHVHIRRQPRDLLHELSRRAARVSWRCRRGMKKP